MGHPQNEVPTVQLVQVQQTEFEDGASGRHPEPVADASSEGGDGDAEPEAGRSSLSLVREHWVLFSQFLAEGFTFATVNGCLYGFLLGYLATPGYVYAAADQIIGVPWALQLPFGMLSDALPIGKRHRRPYLILGWCICALASSLLLLIPLPAPYWCKGADGRYVHTSPGRDGHVHAAAPCNLHAREASGPFVALLALTAVGYVMVSAAANSRTIEVHNEQPGTGLMVTTIACRQLGNVTGFLFVATCMNGFDYNGSFRWGLGLHSVSAVLATVSVVMAMVSSRLREEFKLSRAGAIRAYMQRAWAGLTSSAFAGVAIHRFVTTTLTHMTTTAVGLIKVYWARMKTVHKQANSIGGNLLLSVLLWRVRHKFQKYNWRILTATSVSALQFIDLMVAAITIFDVLRTPYTFTGEVLLSEIPAAIRTAVSQALVAAIAAGDPGLEGFSQGLLWAAGNAGWVTARGAANLLYSLWEPSLSEPGNYIEDAPQFRHAVFTSYLAHCALGVTSLVLLRLLPKDADEARWRHLSWPRRQVFAWLAVLAIGPPYLAGLAMTVLSVIPATMCSALAGGSGCK